MKKKETKRKSKNISSTVGKADSQIKFLEDKTALSEEPLPRNILHDIFIH